MITERFTRLLAPEADEVLHLTRRPVMKAKDAIKASVLITLFSLAIPHASFGASIIPELVRVVETLVIPAVESLSKSELNYTSTADLDFATDVTSRTQTLRARANTVISAFDASGKSSATTSWDYTLRLIADPSEGPYSLFYSVAGGGALTALTNSGSFGDAEANAYSDIKYDILNSSGAVLHHGEDSKTAHKTTGAFADPSVDNQELATVFGTFIPFPSDGLLRLRGSITTRGTVDAGTRARTTAIADNQMVISASVAIPEPSSLVLLGTGGGVLALGLLGRTRGHLTKRAIKHAWPA